MEKSLEGVFKRSEAVRMVDFVRAKCSEVESRKRKLDRAAWEFDCPRESLESRAWELEERKRDFFAFEERRKMELAREEEDLRSERARFLAEVRMREEELDRLIVAANERAEKLAVAEAEVRETRRRACERLKNIEADRESLRLDKESLTERERKVAIVIGTLDARITAVDEKEEAIKLLEEGRMREINLKEENLDKKWKEFAQEVKVWEQEMLKHRLMERIESAEIKLDGVRVKMEERFEEIKCRDSASCGSLALSLREADLIRESVEKKLEELEKMKAEFASFQEEKNLELASKQQLLETMSEELVMDAQLKNDQLIEHEAMVCRLLERLELAKYEVEGMKRSCDERYQELCSKMRELASKEQLLDARCKEVFKDVGLRNEELIERVKLGHQLLERLELAKDNVEGLNRVIHENYRKIGLKESEMDSLRDWVEKKMDEADLKASEFEGRERIIAEKEAHLISKETELQEMEKYLRAQQKELKDEREKIDLAEKSSEQKLKHLDFRERNLNSVRGFIRSCFKEHRGIKRELRTEKDLVEKREKDLILREQHLNNALEDIASREKLVEDTVKLLEQQSSPKMLDAPLLIEPDDSADLKFMVRMDGKTLQMFVNDANKDMEAMGDEIFTVLHLSSDPAKLVLDAMEGFYPPHLRKEDVGFNVRRTCITLLVQLTKMSPKIKPHVREEAIEVATLWKSKLGDTAQVARSLEVLGFLYLLSAFDLFSYFDSDEIAGLLMMVDQLKETAELHYGLGSETSTEGSF